MSATCTRAFTLGVVDPFTSCLCVPGSPWIVDAVYSAVSDTTVIVENGMPGNMILFMDGADCSTIADIGSGLIAAPPILGSIVLDTLRNWAWISSTAGFYKVDIATRTLLGVSNPGTSFGLSAYIAATDEIWCGAKGYLDCATEVLTSPAPPPPTVWNTPRPNYYQATDGFVYSLEFDFFHAGGQKDLIIQRHPVTKARTEMYVVSAPSLFMSAFDSLRQQIWIMATGSPMFRVWDIATASIVASFDPGFRCSSSAYYHPAVDRIITGAYTSPAGPALPFRWFNPATLAVAGVCAEDLDLSNFHPAFPAGSGQALFVTEDINTGQSCLKSARDSYFT